MTRAVRNLGRPGVGAMAISAVDVALWDLKARLLGLPLATLLGAVHDAVPVYGSGGFTSYSIERLQHQLPVGCSRDPAGEDEDRQPPGDDLERVRAARAAIGDDAALFVDANGAYARKQALAQAERFAEQAAVSWFEEPVSSEDLDGLRLLRDRGAGRHGHRGRRVRLRTRLLPAHARGGRGRRACRPTPPAAAGSPACSPSAALCQAHQMPFSAHCAPAAACARRAARSGRCATWSTSTTTPASSSCSSTARSIPSDGALRPDPDRPGLGIELKTRDAEEFAA